MQLKINGKNRELSDSGVLLHVLRQLDIEPENGGVAVALNDVVVPRSQWETTTVADGDRIEIIHAVQGG